MSYEGEICSNYHDASIPDDIKIGYNYIANIYMISMPIIAICLNFWILFTYIRMLIQLKRSKAKTEYSDN